jgi:transposase
MSKDSKKLLIRLGVLALARELGSISLACVAAGISRSLYYKIKAAYERSGVEGLKPVPRCPPRMPNAFSSEIVEQVLELTRRFPSYSYNRIAARLQSEGMRISGSGVRKIWERRGLHRSADRRLWKEAGLNLTNEEKNL